MGRLPHRRVPGAKRPDRRLRGAGIAAQGEPEEDRRLHRPGLGRLGEHQQGAERRLPRHAAEGLGGQGAEARLPVPEERLREGPPRRLGRQVREGVHEGRLGLRLLLGLQGPEERGEGGLAPEPGEGPDRQGPERRVLLGGEEPLDRRPQAGLVPGPHLPGPQDDGLQGLPAPPRVLGPEPGEDGGDRGGRVVPTPSRPCHRVERRGEEKEQDG